MIKHYIIPMLEMDSSKLVLNTHTKFAQTSQTNKFKTKLKYGYSATNSKLWKVCAQ